MAAAVTMAAPAGPRPPPPPQAQPAAALVAAATAAPAVVVMVVVVVVATLRPAAGAPGARASLDDARHLANKLLQGGSQCSQMHQCSTVLLLYDGAMTSPSTSPSTRCRTHARTSPGTPTARTWAMRAPSCTSRGGP